MTIILWKLYKDFNKLRHRQEKDYDFLKSKIFSLTQIFSHTAKMQTENFDEAIGELQKFIIAAQIVCKDLGSDIKFVDKVDNRINQLKDKLSDEELKGLDIYYKTLEKWDNI